MVLDPMLDSVQIIRRQVRNESEIRANIFVNCFLTESVTVRGLTIDQDRLPIPQKMALRLVDPAPLFSHKRQVGPTTNDVSVLT